MKKDVTVKVRCLEIEPAVTAIKFLGEIIIAWKKGTAKWQAKHQTIPAQYVRLAVIMDKAEDWFTGGRGMGKKAKEKS